MSDMDFAKVDAFLEKTAEVMALIEDADSDMESKSFYIDPETKVRRVRDAAYWGMPVNTVITPGMKPVNRNAARALASRARAASTPRSVSVGGRTRPNHKRGDASSARGYRGLDTIVRGWADGYAGLGLDPNEAVAKAKQFDANNSRLNGDRSSSPASRTLAVAEMEDVIAYPSEHPMDVRRVAKATLAHFNRRPHAVWEHHDGKDVVVYAHSWYDIEPDQYGTFTIRSNRRILAEQVRGKDVLKTIENSDPEQAGKKPIKDSDRLFGNKPPVVAKPKPAPKPKTSTPTSRLAQGRPLEVGDLIEDPSQIKVGDTATVPYRPYGKRGKIVRIAADGSDFSVRSDGRTYRGKFDGTSIYGGDGKRDDRSWMTLSQRRRQLAIWQEHGAGSQQARDYISDARARYSASSAPKPKASGGPITGISWRRGRSIQSTRDNQFVADYGSGGHGPNGASHHLIVQRASWEPNGPEYVVNVSEYGVQGKPLWKQSNRTFATVEDAKAYAIVLLDRQVNGSSKPKPTRAQLDARAARELRRAFPLARTTFGGKKWDDIDLETKTLIDHLDNAGSHAWMDDPRYDGVEGFIDLDTGKALVVVDNNTGECIVDPEFKTRYVRKPEYWGVPYGTPITPGMKPHGPDADPKA